MASTWRRVAVYPLILKGRCVRHYEKSTDSIGNPTKARAEAHYQYERLYRNLYNPQLYLLAYQNLYANKGYDGWSRWRYPQRYEPEAN